MMNEASANSLLRLTHLLQEMAQEKTLCLAWSGGLDSRFLAHAANLAGITPILFHIAGVHIPAQETCLAQQRAEKNGWTIHILHLNPLSLPEIRANDKNRCYFCKRNLFSQILQQMQQNGEKGILCDGSNLSDQQGYRPGLRALKELGIRSPLAEAKLDKSEIRRLARLTDLEEPDQSARPCLLTRFVYGLEPTKDLLTQIESLESTVASVWKSLYSETPVPDFRIRFTQEGFLLQMALPPEKETDFMLYLTAKLNALSLPLPHLLRTNVISGYFDRV